MRGTLQLRTYGQYCPIARGAEIFAERWTPLIVRNLHLGCETFGEILAGAFALRTLLTQRLEQLERLGVVESSPKPQGAVTATSSQLRRRPVQGLRDARRVGRPLARDRPREPRSVRGALVDVQRAPPGPTPHQRVVIRFDFTGYRAHERYWLLLELRDRDLQDVLRSR